MKILFTILFLFFSLFVNAQRGSTTISISYGDGSGQRKEIGARAELLGYSSKGPIKTFDLGFSHQLGKFTTVETGVAILNHRYQYTLFFVPNRIPVDKSVNTLIFPVKLKVDLFKYIFVSGGFVLNREIGANESNELDFGFGIGAGLQYYFKNKLGVFIYAQANIHTISIGLSEQHVSAGLAYRFQKK